MIAIDGCHGRATMIVSKGDRRRRVWFVGPDRTRTAPHSMGAYAASEVAYGAHTFPSCAGVSRPAGQISSVTASVKAARMPITA